MKVSDEELDIDDLERRMEGAMTALRHEFQSLRTGRASASMVEPIMVDAYGVMTPINQVGTVNVPEPRMLTINIWDKAIVSKAEKAIRESGLGINPVIDGTIIRLPIPELNEERRREYVKLLHKMAEDARISVRHARQVARDDLKNRIKEHEIGEDEGHRELDEVQKMTDRHIGRIEEMLKKKEEEVMQV